MLGQYTPGSKNIVIEKFGNWEAAARGLAVLGPELASAAMWGQQKAAEKYIKIVKGHIDNQDLGWVPLSENTNSGDTRILVDTEAYRSAIKAWRTGYVYYAGVKSSATNHRGTSIVDYATMHEHGWGHVPKRALWEPSYHEMGGAAGMTAIITAAIYNKLQRLRAAGFTVTM